MASIMSKRGQQDNVITYEHICDTTADLSTITQRYAPLGSVAIVLKGAAGLEVYMATSDHKWLNIATSAEIDSPEA